MQITLHADGGARGNPGPAGCGYVVSDTTSSAVKILRKCGNYCGETTNNQAEYQGLIQGLAWILHNLPTPEKLAIVMDSLLIVNQVKGIYRVKNAALKSRHQETMALLSRFPVWGIVHTYRADNATADSLVNQAIDLRREIVA